MFEIKDYTEDMKDELFTLTDRCFIQCGKRFEPDGRHSFYNDIVQNFVHFECLFDDDAMIGTAAVKKLNDTDCELKALYLDESYQGKGLGRKLAHRAIDLARKDGFKRIYLDCMSTSVNAVSLYEKLGFHKTERYNKNFFADIFMKMEL